MSELDLKTLLSYKSMAQRVVEALGRNTKYFPAKRHPARVAVTLAHSLCFSVDYTIPLLWEDRGVIEQQIDQAAGEVTGVWDIEVKDNR